MAGPAGQAGKIIAGPEPTHVGVVSTDETDRCVSVGEESAHLGGEFIPEGAQVTNPALVVRALGRQGLEHIVPVTGQPPEVVLSLATSPKNRGGASLRCGWGQHGRTVAPTARHGGNG